MVSTNIYNRSEIKENLITIFNKVGKEDYVKAKEASDNLLHSLLVYYKTRGINVNHMYPLFEKLEYYLLYATNNNFKKKIVMDQLEVISNEIKTSTKNPLERLKEIFNDLRYLYYSLHEKSHITEIVDCFDELSELNAEFEKSGGLAYNYYSQMMKNVGNCESILLRLSKERGIKDATISTISEAFSNLFQSIHQVLSPPMRLDISAKEVYKKVKDESVSLEDLSAATGQPFDDLRTMLQTEELMQQQMEMVENE